MVAQFQVDIKSLQNMNAREKQAVVTLVRQKKCVLVDEDDLAETTDSAVLGARNSLTDFMEITGPWKMFQWQKLLCDRLTEIVKRGETGVRMMIHAPPQNGKSIITSQRLPAWVIGQDPLTRFRLACYNETHSESFGEVVLQVMQSDIYREIFPDPRLFIPERAPKGRFSTAGRSEVRDAQPSFLAMGLNTGFVGQGADWLMIDDPYKNREEAFSKVINERIWRFWSVTAQQRISEETNVIVVFHRWAKNDLAGRLMDEGDWDVWRFPAICDGKYGDDPTFVSGLRQIGDPLSPLRSKAFLVKIKEKDPITFAALQQGDPQNEGLNQFRMELLKTHDIYPWSPSKPLLDIYQGHDLAISLKTSADYTVGATVGVDTDQNLYILDLNIKRRDFHSTMEMIGSEAEEWGGEQAKDIIGIGIEVTAYQMAAFQEACKEFMLPFAEVKPKVDKLTRAQLFMRRVAMGKVFVNKEAEWWPELERQMLSFGDETEKDDCIDAIVNTIEQLPVFSQETEEDLPAAEWSMQEMMDQLAEIEEMERKSGLN